MVFSYSALILERLGIWGEVAAVPDAVTPIRAIDVSQRHNGTYLGKAVEQLNQKDRYDRLIVISDEQAHDTVPNPKGQGYVINVASYKNGVGYGKWTHIDGWSEAVIEYIRTLESSGLGS